MFAILEMISKENLQLFKVSKGFGGSDVEGDLVVKNSFILQHMFFLHRFTQVTGL